jgi:hypothetical protein
MALVAIYPRCKHQRVLYPAKYIPRFGQNCFAIELRERLRCTNCHGRMANLHEAHSSAFPFNQGLERAARHEASFSEHAV